MIDLMEAIEKQNAVIRIQLEVIDDLFLDLMNHITVEEADKHPTVKKINLAAEIRKDIDL